MAKRAKIAFDRRSKTGDMRREHIASGSGLKYRLAIPLTRSLTIITAPIDLSSPPPIPVTVRNRCKCVVAAMGSGLAQWIHPQVVATNNGPKIEQSLQLVPFMNYIGG